MTNGMTRAMAVAALLLLGGAAHGDDVVREQMTEDSPMLFQKLTPVLLADDVAACIGFWGEFGFDATVTVPGEDGPSFAILGNGEIELMYQDAERARADNPAAVEGIQRAMIFMEVSSLDRILPIAQRYEVVVPEHTTSYGSREIYVRDPGGNVFGFAEQGAAPAE